jgi:hypothetical protein
MDAAFDLAGAGLVEIDDGALPILHAARELDLIAGFVRHRCPAALLVLRGCDHVVGARRVRQGRRATGQGQGGVHHLASLAGGIGSRLVLAGQRQHEADEAAGRRCGQGAAARRMRRWCATSVVARRRGSRGDGSPALA